MNDHQIYQYLARKPDSRAQDVADALDAELKDASEALRDLVDVGSVVRHAGTGRNGLPSQLYNLSDVFKRSRDGLVILATVAGMVDAAPPSQEPAQEAPAIASVETPVFSQQTEMKPAKTRVDRALDHLSLYKVATDNEMRTAMGLDRIASPRAYLVSAIKTGKIVRDDSGWRLGDGTPPAKWKPSAASRFSVVTPKVGPVAQFGKHDKPVDKVTKDDVRDLPAAVVDQLSKPAQAIAMAPAVFRCGLWSDGVLELQRDGRSLVELTRREGEHLAEFMSRMVGAVESTQF